MKKLHICVLTLLFKHNSSSFRAYIRFRFLNQNKNERREIYPYETTATDTDLVKKLFKTIQEIIMIKILQQTGFQWKWRHSENLYKHIENQLHDSFPSGPVKWIKTLWFSSSLQILHNHFCCIVRSMFSAFHLLVLLFCS